MKYLLVVIALCIMLGGCVSVVEYQRVVIEGVSYNCIVDKQAGLCSIQGCYNIDDNRYLQPRERRY